METSLGVCTWIFSIRQCLSGLFILSNIKYVLSPNNGQGMVLDTIWGRVGLVGGKEDGQTDDSKIKPDLETLRDEIGT